MQLSLDQIGAFGRFLSREEKSAATQGKYLRDVRAFYRYAGDSNVSKELVLRWKQHLASGGYAVRSVNSMLASVNALLKFLGLPECRVKHIRLQRQTYTTEERELTKGEYFRLLEAARGDEQLHLILQTICATGIRVSELNYFTVEAVKRGEITVNCKGKTRTILIPEQVKKSLLRYCRQREISSGAIFVGKSGKGLDRSCIWRRMKRLCRAAGVKESKVFPHNLRKLFARTFYAVEKDIAKLADILGHSSINTTRIYIMSTSKEHRRKIECLGLTL